MPVRTADANVAGGLLPPAHAQHAWSNPNPHRVRAGITFLVTLLVFLLVAVSAQHIGSYFLDKHLPTWVALVPGAVGVIAAVAVLWLAGRGLVRSQRSARAKDIALTRSLADEASYDAWAALSWACALLILTAAAWFLVVNDGAVSRTFLNLNLIASSAGKVLAAFVINIEIFVVSGILMFAWALIVAVARTLPGRVGQPLRILAIAYCDVFRGLPAIICIYLVGFGLPLTNLPFLSGLSSTTYAIIALTLTYGAYTSEIYRAGIESVHQSQIASARSLGLSHARTLRHVVIPLAVRTIIPPLLNNFISLQKDTALVAIIGTIDAFNESKIIAANNFNLSAVTTVAILFVVITIPQARFVDRLSARDRRRMRAGG